MEVTTMLTPCRDDLKGVWFTRPHWFSVGAQVAQRGKLVREPCA
jgi:hypothetical protein